MPWQWVVGNAKRAGLQFGFYLVAQELNGVTPLCSNDVALHLQNALITQMKHETTRNTPKDLDTLAMTDILLPELLTLTRAAVAPPAEAVLEKALGALREKVSEEGRVSNRLIEENQVAAHGGCVAGDICRGAAPDAEMGRKDH